MKNIFYLMLAATQIWCGKANAQEALLPFGQFAKEPWTATYFYATIASGEQPDGNWFAEDFDDSSWGTIKGPLSIPQQWNDYPSLPFFATEWSANNSSYWIRRHFTIQNVEEFKHYMFVVIHDDGCVAYLNGKQIWNKSSRFKYPEYGTLYSYNSNVLTDAIKEGDNVLAVYVTDSGGGMALMDFGLYGLYVQPLTNPQFDNNLNGWTCTGSGIERGGQSFNYVARCLSTGSFDVHQTISGCKGLYRLRAQVFETTNSSDYPASYAVYQTDKGTHSDIYIGDTRHAVKNIFDEQVKDNIYSSVSSGSYNTPEGTFVPSLQTAVSIAYQDGMYENEMYAYVDTMVFNIGVDKREATEEKTWTVFDNFRLDFISEKNLTALIASMNTLASQPMEKDYLTALTALNAKLKTAQGYEAKARMLAAQGDDYVNARISSEQYALVSEAVDALQCRLDTGTMMSVAAIAEATALIAQTRTKIAEGTLPTSEAKDVTDQLKELNKRLNYTYIDITVSVLGSLGDSILAHVENFVDVQSIKLSGTLADADISIIQNRLTQLREIDMTGVKMTTLPNKFFYQRKTIELFKLPTNLTSIGEYAFYQCYAMKHIDFPVTLTTINRYAFSECDNLQEVILPEGLTTMGERAFYSCDNNKYVKLPSTLKVIESYTFYYNISLSAVDFAEGLTHINGDAFYECSALKSLQFPSTLYFIGGEAFRNCNAVTSIDFNEGLYQIADNAFLDCDALTEVTLPSSLVLANASPFDYCDNLRKVTCLSIEPPYMTDQIPYGLSMDGRELFVPALSINTYKQTAGWDKFQSIKPIDYLPENINVLTDLRLTLPEGIPADYKPNVKLIHDQKGTSYWQYGSLTVNGVGTLSMANFTMIWDPNYQYDQYNRTQNYCSLVNNSHLRADDVSIDVATHNDRWMFLTMPFDVKISQIEDLVENANWVIRRYDGQKRANGEMTDTWIKAGNDDLLKAGEGFIFQSSRYIGSSSQSWSSFRMKAINNTNKNNIFRTTDVTVALNTYESEFAHNRSWNLIGNPYPCYYDTRFMDFEAPITVWNMRNNTYQAYSPSDDSYILCPGEAFFVQRPVDNGNIVFSKEGRQTNRNVRTIEASRRVSYDSPRTIINLSLSDGNNTDRTRIVLNDNATLQYEMNKDASKFKSADVTVPQLFTTTEGVDYAINERPLADEQVCLSVYIGTEGLYTIALTNEVNGYNVVLEDKAANKFVDLTADGEYTFSAEAGTYTSRFVLHFDNETTGIEDVRSNANDDAAVYSVEGVKMTNPSKRGVYIQNGKKIMLNK